MRLILDNSRAADTAEGLAALNKSGDVLISVTDIEKACSEGRAFLFWGQDNDFVALCPRHNWLLGQRYLLVWLAYAKEPSAIQSYTDEICELAADMGATYVEAQTSLEGVGKLLSRAGYQRAYTIFKREV